MIDMKNSTDALEEDIRREYDVARENCKLYFERMYKILKFSLGVMVAVIGIDFGVLGGGQSSAFSSYIIFLYIFPVCLYILGLLYTYNAYSLSVYGNETCALRKRLYDKKDYGSNELNGIMREYVKTKRCLAVISYGACVLFYIFGPLISILFAYWRYSESSPPKSATTHCDCLGSIFDFICTPCFTIGIWVFYLLAMGFLIIAIRTNLRKRNGKAKKKNDSSVSTSKCSADVKAVETADKMPTKDVKEIRVYMKRRCCKSCQRR